MYKLNEILRAVGRIEGRLDEYHKLNDRVSSLERWQSWLKGGWAVPVGAYAYFFRSTWSRGDRAKALTNGPSPQNLCTFAERSYACFEPSSYGCGVGIEYFRKTLRGFKRLP